MKDKLNILLIIFLLLAVAGAIVGFTAKNAELANSCKALALSGGVTFIGFGAVTLYYRYEMKILDPVVDIAYDKSLSVEERRRRIRKLELRPALVSLIIAAVLAAAYIIISMSLPFFKNKLFIETIIKLFVVFFVIGALYILIKTLRRPFPSEIPEAEELPPY